MYLRFLWIFKICIQSSQYSFNLNHTSSILLICILSTKIPKYWLRSYVFYCYWDINFVSDDEFSGLLRGTDLQRLQGLGKTFLLSRLCSRQRGVPGCQRLLGSCQSCPDPRNQLTSTDHRQTEAEGQAHPRGWPLHFTGSCQKMPRCKVSLILCHWRTIP